METEPGADRHERVVDWLAAHPDLPHLFARLSELVLVHGHAPQDLVVLPRSEIDRRETTAFTAGWAEAVSAELPRIRREYEKRVADAYTQGQSDARGIRRPERRVESGQEGARVITLPFARLLEPPTVVVEAEERVRRERELFEQRPGTEPEPEPESGPARAPDPEPGKEPGVLLTAQESRARRRARPVRKVVRGKGGRPIVPPLAGVPAQGGPNAERRDQEPAGPEPRAGGGRRLSERAKDLEKELSAERAREAPPESAP
ncbi:hypothetical protein [Streptomyces sp. NPDC059247]|uniref:hypothetical protein n=1 Tax=Streptomyces sp. NPDC059247 TaxID=3346790 RepID=UPI0036C8D1D6